MKYLIHSHDEFTAWYERINNLFTIKTKKQPQSYPCIAIGWSIENDCIGKDWYEFEIIYKGDFDYK